MSSTTGPSTVGVTRVCCIHRKNAQIGIDVTSATHVAQVKNYRTARRRGVRCYHQACDSLTPVEDGADAELYAALNAAYGGALEYNGVISNVNTVALEEMADAVAHAILTYAMSTSSVSGTAKGSPVAGEKVGD